MELSAEAQINNAFPALDRAERAELLELVLKNAQRAHTVAEVDIRNETTQDFTNSPELNQAVFHYEGQVGGGLNIDQLAGLGNEIRIVSHTDINDAVDLVLRVAEINAEISMAQTIENCDLGFSEGTLGLLREKMRRCGVTPEQLKLFVGLLTLEQIPDVRPAIQAGEISVFDIIGMRDKSAAVNFRRWFHATEAQDVRELEQAYVAAIGKNRSALLPVTLLRLFITTGIGTWNPLAGFSAGAVDSLFVNKWLEGYSPRLFLDMVRTLPIADQ